MLIALDVEDIILCFAVDPLDGHVAVADNIDIFLITDKIAVIACPVPYGNRRDRSSVTTATASDSGACWKEGRATIERFATVSTGHVWFQIDVRALLQYQKSFKTIKQA